MGRCGGKDLLTKLGLNIGDRVRVGEASFVITGIIDKEPDRVATVLSFGPRLMVSSQSLAATKLVRPGSQIRYWYRAVLPDGVVPSDWIDQVKAEFPTAGWRIRAGSGRPGSAALYQPDYPVPEFRWAYHAASGRSWGQ